MFLSVYKESGEKSRQSAGAQKSRMADWPHPLWCGILLYSQRKTSRTDVRLV